MHAKENNMDAIGFRAQFPILERRVNGRPLVYFDNAATSQRPQCVVDRLEDMNLKHNANIHRAVHRLADEATAAYEQARDDVATYLNAASRREIIFTSGDTAAINLVAYSFGQAFIEEGDEIVVGEAEHHSNIVPWQLMAARKKAVVRYWKVREDGTYALEDLRQLLTGRTRLVCVGHVSNVLGLLNPVREIVEICHAQNVPVLVDGAQGVVHTAVDVQAMDCDFYAFSAHKVYGPTGVGVLYGKEKWLAQMPPFLSGGEMVGTVSIEGTTFADLPMKFEAGTQNFSSVPALSQALDVARNVLEDKELNVQFEKVSQWLYENLLRIDGLRLFGEIPANAEGYAGDASVKFPIYSFCIDGVHHEDMALLMDKMGVAVRSGQMCAEPLMTRYGVTGMLRASLLPYNTMDEAEYFMDSLKRAVAMLK